MVRYLLGELSADERAKFEDHYFADGEVYEYLLAVEDELIDAYARDELTPPRRKRFEERFLKGPKAERVVFARDLKSALESEQASPAGTVSPSTLAREATRRWHLLLPFSLAHRPAVAFSLAGLLLLLLVGGLVWLAVERGRELERRRLAEGQTEPARQEDETTVRPPDRRPIQEATPGGVVMPPPPASHAPESASQTPRRRDEQPPAPLRVRPVIISITLSPDRARSTGAGNDAGRDRLTIPPGAESVRLRLNLKEGVEYQSYSAALETIEGAEVISRGPLRAHGSGEWKAVTLTLPVSALQTGGYILRLRGNNPLAESEVIADYYFSVDKN